MGNHCIDVICLDCGRQWCTRGCGHDEPKPNSDAIKRYIKRQKDWCTMWSKPFNLGYKMSNSVCACGGKEIYMD